MQYTRDCIGRWTHEISAGRALLPQHTHIIFFFSSRRRHTRLQGDWSSDVCSSDLALFTGLRLTDGVSLDAIRARYGVDVWHRFGAQLEPFVAEGCLTRDGERLRLTQIGRASCRERV